MWNFHRCTEPHWNHRCTNKPHRNQTNPRLIYFPHFNSEHWAKILVRQHHGQQPPPETGEPWLKPYPGRRTHSPGRILSRPAFCAELVTDGWKISQFVYSSHNMLIMQESYVIMALFKCNLVVSHANSGPLWYMRDIRHSYMSSINVCRGGWHVYTWIRFWAFQNVGRLENCAVYA